MKISLPSSADFSTDNSRLLTISSTHSLFSAQPHNHILQPLLPVLAVSPFSGNDFLCRSFHTLFLLPFTSTHLRLHCRIIIPCSLQSLLSVLAVPPLSGKHFLRHSLSSYFSFSYISSVTVSHHSDDVFSPGTSIARCENHSFGAAPCQCFTSAGILTQSPGFISTASFPSS